MASIQIIRGRTTRPVTVVESRRIQVFVPFQGVASTAVALQEAAAFLKDLGGMIRIAAPVVVPYPLPLDRPTGSQNWVVGQVRRAMASADVSGNECTVDLAYVRDWKDGIREMLPAHCIVFIGGATWWDGWRAWRMGHWLRRMGHEVLRAEQVVSRK